MTHTSFRPCHLLAHLVDDGFKDEQRTSGADYGQWLSREDGIDETTDGSGQNGLHHTLWVNM